MTATTTLTVLENLEDDCLDNHILRGQNYQKILEALEEPDVIDIIDIERILKVCLHDSVNDKQYTAVILKVIAAILKRVVKDKEACNSLSFLTPTAFAIVDIVKTSAPLSGLDSLKIMCFNTLSLYPDATFLALAKTNEDLLVAINLNCQINTPLISLQVYKLLRKLFHIMPTETKKSLVGKHIPVWFHNVIPSAISIIKLLNESQADIVVQVLEHLTTELLPFEYTTDLHWHEFLENICKADKYPLLLKQLLENGNAYWHRIWIVIIKLLKNQITQTFRNNGIPINLMLPVVEAAFKVDVTNRCRALDCWHVLIDSFVDDINDSNLTKRLRLLLVPLNAHNAKVEKIAIAKFDCWWHLIVKFQNKMDKYLDSVIVSFLNFVYGSHKGSGSVTNTLSVQRKTFKAIVDMLGHVCRGGFCTRMPKLSGKLVTAKHVIDNWHHWIHAVSKSMQVAVYHKDVLSPRQLECMWRSFLAIIDELPQNNIRRDLFTDVISVVRRLLQEPKDNDRLRIIDTILNCFVFSLFNDLNISNILLITDDVENSHLTEILKLLLDPCLDDYYKSYKTTALVNIFKPVAITILLIYATCSSANEFVLYKLPHTNITLYLWMAFAKSISVAQPTCAKVLSSILLYPLKQAEHFSDIQKAGMSWYNLYDQVISDLKVTSINAKVLKYLSQAKTYNESRTNFSLYVILAVLKNMLKSHTECHNEIETLREILSNIESYESIEEIFPVLVDVLTQFFTNLNVNKHKIIMTKALQCLMNTLRILTRISEDTDLDCSYKLIKNALNALIPLIQIYGHYGIGELIAEELIKHSSILCKQGILKNDIVSLMKTIESNTKDVVAKKISTAIKNIASTQAAQSEIILIDITSDNPIVTEEMKSPSSESNNEKSITTIQSNISENDTKTPNAKERIDQTSNLGNGLKSNEDIPNSILLNNNSVQPNATDSKMNDAPNSKEIIIDAPEAQNVSENDKPSDKKETSDNPLVFTNNTSVQSKLSENNVSNSFNTNPPNKTGVQSNVTENNNFNIPNTMAMPKKSKKVELRIVSKVVANEEGYVILENKYKLNPKKMTEKQKEKLNRKSEDIPALYQDLSQSQDEFKLATWKTDSQDTSNTNSNSNMPESTSNRPANEELATSILQNMPSLKVVPSIAQKFLSGNEKTNKPNALAVSSKDNSNKMNTPPIALKSPRMALKDRVFRNVRNLIENSTLQKENASNGKTDSMVAGNNNKEPNNTEIIQTSTSPNIPKILESALPLVSSERPSRVKRKPKKFDDVELLALKRKRNSHQDAHVKFGQHNVEIHSTKDFESDSPPPEDSVDKRFDIVNTNAQNTDVIQEVDNDINQNTEQDKVGHNELNNKKASEDKLKEMNEIEVETNLVVNKESDTNTFENPNIHDHQTENDDGKDIELATPKKAAEIKNLGQKSTVKKKKSRIESELAIDMVEGHPFLSMQSEKRLTRKSSGSPVNVGRRKNLSEKPIKSISDSGNEVKGDKKNKEKVDVMATENSIIVMESQDSSEVIKGPATADLPNSEDVIESSQDSTFSTVSVKSTKRTPKRTPNGNLDKLKKPTKTREKINESQSILDCGVLAIPESLVPLNSKEDIELSQNKTAVEEKTFENFTENMDTEPIDVNTDVVIVNDELPAPISISSEDTAVGPDTQELAEADTQPTDPAVFLSSELPENTLYVPDKANLVIPDIKVTNPTEANDVVMVNQEVSNDKTISTPEELTRTLSESVCAEIEKESEVSSPLKNETQRKQDFLNNTVEISPIKTMSPDRDKTSPSPETSSDYVVIKLTSPVQSNGEPFDKSGSPEFFTDDKVSPDKRDLSPPRQEATVTNTSPSSSLSLKKRSQVRSGGRGAQMLGLCAPDKLQTIISSERNESEDVKKSSPSTTAARRNLKIMYQVAFNENNDEGAKENNDGESFLKFRKSLPAVGSSPSGPILKRKLAEITDDATASPANKRKRVSFHDPPVSTTISVQKYIEPMGARSPQNSAQKRLERQMRQHTPIKSPKRLENSFKLDTVLTKAIESFSEEELANNTDDTQPISLDETPSVEIVKASELNDSQPICPDLVDCKDPIDVIAAGLSSPAMKSLLVKELEGKIETVGDLAKMTELDVNRLCIKAPKVKVVQRVLTDYVAKRASKPQEETVSINEAMFDETMTEAVAKPVEIGIQTEIESVEMEVQTTPVPVSFASSQTEVPSTSHISVQTNESGNKTTADIINTCILERPDFVSELRDCICEKLDSKELILLCSQILQRVHDKPA